MNEKEDWEIKKAKKYLDLELFDYYKKYDIPNDCRMSFDEFLEARYTFSELVDQLACNYLMQELIQNAIDRELDDFMSRYRKELEDEFMEK